MLQISPKTGPIVCAIAYIHIAMSNILKTEAAQTNKTIWGKFGAYGGLSDLRMTYKYYFNI